MSRRDPRKVHKLSTEQAHQETITAADKAIRNSRRARETSSRLMDPGMISVFNSPYDLMRNTGLAEKTIRDIERLTNVGLLLSAPATYDLVVRCQFMGSTNPAKILDVAVKKLVADTVKLFVNIFFRGELDFRQANDIVTPSDFDISDYHRKLAKLAEPEAGKSGGASSVAIPQTDKHFILFWFCRPTQTLFDHSDKIAQLVQAGMVDELSWVLAFLNQDNALIADYFDKPYLLRMLWDQHKTFIEYSFLINSPLDIIAQDLGANNNEILACWAMAILAFSNLDNIESSKAIAENISTLIPERLLGYLNTREQGGEKTHIAKLATTIQQKYLAIAGTISVGTYKTYGLWTHQKGDPLTQSGEQRAQSSCPVSFVAELFVTVGAASSTLTTQARSETPKRWAETVNHIVADEVLGLAKAASATF